MKVRTKAFVETIGAIAAMTGAALLLQYWSPKWGFVVYFGALGAYLVYCLYNVRVSQLEMEQTRIVDELKK